jgi:acyl carrier protein
MRDGDRSAVTLAESRDDDLIAKVCAIVVRTIEVPDDARPLNGGTPLLGAGLGVDSLDALRLVAALEEEFGITIDDAQLTPDSLQDIDAIASLVRRLSTWAR